MPRQIIQDERWDRRQEHNRTFDFITFDHTKFHNSQFEDCVFSRCHFENAYLGFRVSYVRCTWRDCNFHGKYLTLGAPSHFQDCIFDKVKIQSASMCGAKFTNCVFRAELKNIIMHGPNVPATEPVVFENCDMTQARLLNVSFYGGVDLSTVELPVSSVRVFDNKNGEFSKALLDAAASLPKNEAIGLSVLGSQECYGDQDPVVFSVETVVDLLESQQSISEFERIAKSYEISPRDRSKLVS